MPHVLHATRDRGVGGAEGDGASDRGHGGHRARAHPVDGVSRHRRRQPGQDRGAAADSQALVAGLSGGRDGHVADPLGRERGIAPEQFADHADHHVVRPGLGVQAGRAGLAEWRPDAIGEHDIACDTGHGTLSALRNITRQ
jgi:hypothetical protein